MIPVRVLVVDDSAVVRKLLCEALASSPNIEVAGTAASGTIALAKIPQLNPDLITLDLEMPGFNGLRTLGEIRRMYPKIPVIMVSSLTERGAAATLEALSLGASDYVTKPSQAANLASAIEQIRAELTTKILLLCSWKSGAPTICAPTTASTKREAAQRKEILAIGASTGGPNALIEVIPRLPQDFPVPVVVVQHMPPMFTRLLAQRLDSLSLLRVGEAEPGRILEPGRVWIAPGDYHLRVTRKGSAAIMNLNQELPENSCRPAVDVLFRSVAEAFGPNVLAVVMTGMGSDGARGAIRIREAGGEVLVQDEDSSVVWGMPGAVVNAGAADKVCALSEISSEIVRRVSLGRVLSAAAAWQ